MLAWKFRRFHLAFGVSLISGLSLATGASAAGTSHTVQAQKDAGSYHLLLKIGPAEMMNMGGKSEHTMGGANANCNMSMSGMTEAGAPKKDCNHHVELHVYSGHTTKVVQHAQVTIRLVNTKTHATIVVPIMTMMSGGTSDYHYGNNVFAPAGAYNVPVTINRARTSFTVTLT